jgi:hypothetical protein
MAASTAILSFMATAAAIFFCSCDMVLPQVQLSQLDSVAFMVSMTARGGWLNHRVGRIKATVISILFKFFAANCL